MDKNILNCSLKLTFENQNFIFKHFNNCDLDNMIRRLKEKRDKK